MINDTNYCNRELSWLEFNQRVLEQALCQSTPLLERVKFLAITAANLDEFFMVRVGGLMIQADNKPESTDIVGMSAAEQLQAIRDRVQTMVADQYRCLDGLLEALKEHGIERLNKDDLTGRQLDHLQRLFDEEISAVVSPVAVEDMHNFPAMIGATFGLCVRLKGNSLSQSEGTEQRFVVLSVRRVLQRIWTVPTDEGIHFVMLEDVLAMFAESFFPNQEILETVPFRTMRNADVTVDEEAADLLAGMQEMLQQRRTSDCVRLEVDSSASPQTFDFLKSCLQIEDEQIYRIAGPVDLSTLFSLASVQGYRELKYEPWPSQTSPEFAQDENIFDVIAERDRVLIHPYQDYQPVVDFVIRAAADPAVIAIKQTLYRTSRNSEMVNALRSAAESGKHVTVIVELKARFDEKRNIAWASKLEDAGVDVIYGVRGLKTHAKLCLVVRREADGIRRYMHFGTGNYNESTARIYSDISLFTCDRELGADAVNLFNAVSGLSIPQPMSQLIAAPIALREKFEQLIDVEIANAREERPALIRAKFNSLVDKKIIDHLYEASQAGVQIEINVRGICCLRPGVPGISENIRVVSIVDRFLEHARVFYFLHGGDHRVFIASADWMGRNLDRRIELMVPVLDPRCAEQVQRTLQSYFADNVNAYEILSDGSFQRRVPEGGQAEFRSQQHLYQIACQLHAESNLLSRQTFKPHRRASE